MASKAWLLSAMGDVRTYGGNDGYDDEPETVYRWDSNVANHGGPEEGDFIVLRSKQLSLGASVIERIVSEPGSKTLRYCPNGHSEINKRKRLKPTYRCGKCKEEFDDPVTKIVDIATYTATYSAAWFDLYGVFSSLELRAMCRKTDTQHSIRELDWEGFRIEAINRCGHGFHAIVEKRQKRIAGGRRDATVRVRNGQADFRKQLLEEYGASCAFTGPAPVEALDAAHLYSFAQDDVHHEHGGLLLRKDLHRLFDLGIIAIDPEALRISAPRLSGFPEYARLESALLQVTLKPQQILWLRRHWKQHRT